jgi:hypothetical protein
LSAAAVAAIALRLGVAHDSVMGYISAGVAGATVLVLMMCTHDRPRKHPPFASSDRILAAGLTCVSTGVVTIAALVVQI